MLGAETLSGNWLAIHRAMRDHPLVGFGKPVAPADPKRGSYSRAEAWQDILMLAAYRDTEVMNKGRRMTVGTGEFLGAYDWLASRWNWTMKTVRVFLTKLMDEMMLAKRSLGAGSKSAQDGSEQGKQRSNKVQVLSVCNYTKYQFSKGDEGQAVGQANGKHGASQGQESNNRTIQQDSSAIADVAPPAEPAVAAPEKRPAKSRPRTSRGTLLPADWALPDEWREHVKDVFGLNDAFIEREAGRFKRWWLSPDAKNRLKKDWRSTWINWMDRAQQRGGSPGTLFTKPASEKRHWERTQEDELDLLLAAGEKRHAG